MKQEKILHYYAVFEPAKEGGYNVLFPSFSGCVTFGRTFEEAKEKAQEILELWLEELRTENQKIPLASDNLFSKNLLSPRLPFFNKFRMKISEKDGIFVWRNPGNR